MANIKEWVKEWWWVWIIISSIVTWIFGYFIRPWFASRTTLIRKLAATYLVPFRKWCSDFYGELNEFNRRYLDKDFSNISDLQIIVDYRELHETLRYAPRWIGKIGKKKKYKPIRDNLLKLIELVDTFWHNLENEYSQELPSKDNVKLFEEHIKALSGNKRQEIAQKLREHIQKQKGTYECANILDILKYLEKKIP